MGDYIQHQSALDAIEAEHKAVHHASQMECTEEACHDEYVITRALERLAVRVQIIPSADVRPVVRGRWSEKPYLLGTTNVCSVCGENYGMPHGKYNFCPNCGARMDADKEAHP